MITFNCPNCQTSLARADKEAGVIAVCHSCGNETTVPLPVAPSVPADDRIRFNCPHCNRGIKAKLSQGGLKVNCPGCKKQLQVPKQQLIQVATITPPAASVEDPAATPAEGSAESAPAPANNVLREKPIVSARGLAQAGSVLFLGLIPCIAILIAILIYSERNGGSRTLGPAQTASFGKPSTEQLNSMLPDSKWRATNDEEKTHMTVEFKPDSTYDYHVSPGVGAGLGHFLDASGSYTFGDNKIVLTVKKTSNDHHTPEGTVIVWRVLSLDDSKMKVYSDSSRFAGTFVLDRVY